MAINIVEAVFSQTGVTIDLNSGATTVGEALKQFVDDNISDFAFLPEYVSFLIEDTEPKNQLTSLGFFNDSIFEFPVTVWAMRETAMAGDTDVTLERFGSNNPFPQIVVEGYRLFAMSSDPLALEPNQSYKYKYADGTDIQTKAVGTQDALTATPMISSTDEYSVFGSGFSDRIFGSDNDDFLRGRGGSDEIFAGAGNDTLRGGGGADLLVGEAGSDVLTGGGGADLFGFTLDDMIDTVDNGSLDTITDFSGDAILLDGLQAFTFADRALAGIGDTVFVIDGLDTDLYVRRAFNGGLANQFRQYAVVQNASLTLGDFVTI